MLCNLVQVVPDFCKRRVVFPKLGIVNVINKRCGKDNQQNRRGNMGFYDQSHFDRARYPSCRRAYHMKSLQIQRAYTYLPSLCLPYVEMNKRIICKDRRYGKSLHSGGLSFPHTGLLTWQLGWLEVICLIVVWCNIWEFRAMAFDRIPHNPILCMMGGFCPFNMCRFLV